MNTLHGGVGPGFTFTYNGFFAIAGHDGGGISSLKDGNDVGPVASQEITAMFTNGSGTGTLGGGITFAPGGVLEIFSDAGFDFGSATGINGANNGDSIGTFQLVSGSGIVDPTGVPNGLLTLIFKATALDAGVWKNQAGVDLSTLLGGPQDLLFGFVTTNASLVGNPSALLSQELGELVGTGPVSNNVPTNVIISNNGQYRLTQNGLSQDEPNQVPEPASMTLMGMGLLGFRLSRRNRSQRVS